MQLLVTEEHLARLPLFPLPGVVFFPQTALPLHIFEPRYRVMTQYCSDRAWPMAVTLMQGTPGEPSGKTPPYASVAGVGHLVMRELHDDGRSHIVLQGVARVEILAELDVGTPYRVVRARLRANDWPADRTSLQGRVQEIRTVLSQLVMRDPKVAAMVSGQLLALKNPAILADTLCATFLNDPEARQAQLACRSVSDRLDGVFDRLTELLAYCRSPESHRS